MIPLSIHFQERSDWLPKTKNKSCFPFRHRRLETTFIKFAHSRIWWTCLKSLPSLDPISTCKSSSSYCKPSQKRCSLLYIKESLVLNNSNTTIQEPKFQQIEQFLHNSNIIKQFTYIYVIKQVQVQLLPTRHRSSSSKDPAAEHHKGAFLPFH